MLMIEAYNQWRELATDLPQDDLPMNAESWNNYTDALCKDGELTDLQYRYCPAWDDTIPDDAENEREYLLDALGVDLVWIERSTRPDADEWSKSARHFWCSLKRGGVDVMSFWFSCGPAFGVPNLVAVMDCLISDTATIQNTDTFEEWADDLGYDDDSRKAERTYNACKDQAAKFGVAFSDVSFDDLAALFEDY